MTPRKDGDFLKTLLKTLNKMESLTLTKEPTFIEQELKKFNVTDAAINELANKYLPLTINGIADRKGYNEVDEARKAYIIFSQIG